MTEKLFEQNAYVVDFDAKVIACERKKEHFEIQLDRTAFFPEGGGQPGDHGWIDSNEIFDTHEKDGIIWHYSDKSIEPGSLVHGKIDWSFRLSNMQNHAGEHIVSGLIHKHYGYDNVGFHMGTDCVTLDMNGILTFEQVQEIEAEANEAIQKNLPIHAFLVDPEKQDSIEYRSKKEILSDLRLVEIPGYDRCACCGTHPMYTGEIRLIKILSVQKYKGGVRISMLSGQRALDDYGQKHEHTQAISRKLSAKPEEIVEAVDRVLHENGELKYAIGALKKQLLAFKAKYACGEADPICILDDTLEGNDLREYANLLSEQKTRVLVLTAQSEDMFRYVLFDRKGEAKNLGKELQERFKGKGGGSDEMIQGTLQGSIEEIKTWFEGQK